MQFWHFSEAPYPYLPAMDEMASMRVTLPNGVIDPDRASALWNRYLREWEVADECGLNVMVNEHHATATCMNPSGPVIAGILARTTRNARILILGNPLSNRRDPIRVAEEMALIDVISCGRLEVGFVRGAQFEVGATNSYPVRMTERLWEAIALITRAWTTHDGPFSWEGEFFHHRQVNIWPRPYQQPAPPIWVTALNPGSVHRIADHGYRMATFLTGYEGARKLFDAYRARRADQGLSAPGEDSFGYAALVYTGRTDAEGRDGARELLWYLHNNKVAPEFTFPPGYMPYTLRAMGMRSAAAGVHDPALVLGFRSPATMTLDELIDKGIVFAGSPRTVTAQIERFHERVGGVGHLLLMGQAGFMDHDTTVRGITAFAEDVAPALSGHPVGVPA